MTAPGGAAPSASARAAISGSRRVAEVLAVTAIGGLVVGCGMRWATAGALIGLGFAILMAPAVIERWRAPVLGFLPGWLVAGTINVWAMSSFGWFVPILIVPILTWQFALAPVLARVLWRATRWPAFVVLPLAQASGELLRPLGVGDYTMFQVGTALHTWKHLIQAADLVGGLGLSALWMIPCGLVVDALRAFVDGDRTRLRRTLLVGGTTSAAVLAALAAYGTYRLRTEQIVEGPRLGILQPNLDHAPELVPETLRVQIQTTVERIPDGAADLIVWPENAIFAAYEAKPEYQASVEFLIRRKRVPLLFGAQGFGPDKRRPTSSVLLVDTAGRLAGRYDKVVLFPFTERRVAPWLEHVFPWASDQLVALTRKAWNAAPDGVAGPGALPITAEIAGRRWTFWTPLCYESGYANLGREAARNGAEFFVNLTAEGWLGWAISQNQAGVNILRAVENRVGLVRVGNSGPSGFFLPTGVVDKMLRGDSGSFRQDTGVLVHTIKTDPRHGRTLYARAGGFIDAFWLVALAGGCVWGFARRGWKVSPRS